MSHRLFPPHVVSAYRGACWHGGKPLDWRRGGVSCRLASDVRVPVLGAVVEQAELAERGAYDYAVNQEPASRLWMGFLFAGVALVCAQERASVSGSRCLCFCFRVPVSLRARASPCPPLLPRANLSCRSLSLVRAHTHTWCG